MALSTTENKLYLVELAPPFERLEIQFMPQEIGWTRSIEMAPVAVVGRNNTKKHYTGGDDQINFQLDFYSDSENRRDVLDKVNWVRSLGYADGGTGPARNIKLIWGDMFRREVWVVKSIRYTLNNFNSFYGMLPQQALIDLTLELDPAQNLRLKDVRQ